VSLNVGLSAAAAFVLVAAIPGVVVLWNARRLLPPESRVALRTLEVALGVALGWIIVTAAIALLGSTGDAVGAGSAFADDPRAHAFALAGAIAVPLATVLMLAGVERLPGVVDSAQTRLRWRVDVLLMASAIFLSGWILAGFLGNDAQQFQLHPTWSVLAGAPPVLAATLALAFGIVMLVRSAAAPASIASLMAGVVAIAVGGAGLVISLLAAVAWALVASGGLVSVSLLIFGWRATRRQLLHASTGEVRTGWLMSVVTISIALVMIIAEVSMTGSLDAVGATAGVLTGFALVSRQGLALVDSKRLSQRLQDDEARLRQMAFADALTGVANRRELLRVLHEDSIGGPACVLLAIDLDGFKNINDLRGHDVGDAVLVEVAQRLRANLRPGDLAARMGGDEFAVLMWAQVDDAHTAAQRLLATLGLPYQTDAGSVFVSASIGLAGHETATDIAGLLRNADLALRFAKLRGKDRVERYDKTYDEWLRRRTNIEHELRGAISREELSLAFQPVVALPGAKPVGVEALLRWNHPRLGSVPPDEFIPIAEESGLIGALDRWVLNHACHQLGRWLEAGHDLWLAVNISARELHLVDYVTQVLETARSHRIEPQRLVLEITEHTVAEDMDELVGQLSALRTAGVRIALDDFGAGYSSLGQLRSLPVDILKIDRSLVGDPARSGTSREARPLVDVVVGLGRRLGLAVIAEGVAEPAERTVVEAAGCKLGQGDLFCRAMPAERIEAMLISGGPVAAEPGGGGPGAQSATIPAQRPTPASQIVT
jgi:diguanylate cyclase (GGDEF)-like protein